MTEIQPEKRRHSPAEIARPTCPKCQAVMDLAPFVPGLGHFAHRIFECDKCGDIRVIPDA